MGYPPFSSMFLAFHPGKICEEKQYLKKKKHHLMYFKKKQKNYTCKPFFMSVKVAHLKMGTE